MFKNILYIDTVVEWLITYMFFEIVLNWIFMFSWFVNSYDILLLLRNLNFFKGN